MDEAQEILLSSLKSSGVSIPGGLSSTRGLTSDALFSICAQSLRLLDETSPLLPTSLPSSRPDRFKLCKDIAPSLKSLGYRGDLSFHQFLYPSQEDSYNLMRFLVERLSESSEDRKVDGKQVISAASEGNETVVASFSVKPKEWIERVDNIGNSQSYPEQSEAVPEEDDVHELLDARMVLEQANEAADACLTTFNCVEVGKIEIHTSKEVVKGHSQESEKPRDLTMNGEQMIQRNGMCVVELEQKLASLHEELSKMTYELKDLRQQDNLLIEESHSKASEIQNLEEEHDILKAALDMAVDDRHPVGFYVEELNKRVEARRQRLVDLESQWSAYILSFEEKRVERSLCAQKPEVQGKLKQLEEVELEREAIMLEIHKREEQCSKLLLELKKQPKLPSRKSYIQRVTEITKNSWKQDADIERILQDTRELQIESNSIQERLQRTYAVFDETVFRGAKKDATRRHAYRLLTTIHESFQQISDTILSTDRVQRESAEQEAKLAAMASCSFDINKLQADLDAIRKENELLEQQLQKKLM